MISLTTTACCQMHFPFCLLQEDTVPESEDDAVAAAFKAAAKALKEKQEEGKLTLEERISK